jgi:hypothetical protein
MKTLGSLFLTAALAFAQSGHGGGNTYGSKSGFGNVVFPGTGHAPNTAPGVGIISNPRFGAGLGATVGGYPGYNGAARGRGRAPVVYVPYGYPVFTGGYGYGYDQQQPVMVYPQQQGQQAPTVIINQNFTPETAHPVVREYSQEPGSDSIRIYEPPPPRAVTSAPAEPEQKIFLIAFKDHTIYSAMAYWVEGDTLHYVTTQGTHNQASLDMIDRDFTDRLNRERNVDMRLPQNPKK